MPEVEEVVNVNNKKDKNKNVEPEVKVEEKPTHHLVNQQQQLFVVQPNDNTAREYLDQEQINNFINSSSNDPLKFMVGSLGRKDITKQTFLNEFSIANVLENEIRNEFEMLPVTGKLMI